MTPNTSILYIKAVIGSDRYMHNLPFNYKKAVQAINFFAHKNGGKITKLHVLKLVFFADRYHLRKYGRLITNDQYLAMQFGPVASYVKETTELDSLCGKERHYAGAHFKKINPEYTLEAIRLVDEDVFSDSDLEALEFAWTQFGDHLGHLVNITHRYPEWKKHENTLKGQSRVPMDLFDFLKDPDPGTNPCWELSNEEKKLRRESLEHQNHIEMLWR